MLDLERRLGRELFFRMPRGYELTNDGKRFLGHAISLEKQVLLMIPKDAERAPPLVKISAGVWVTHSLCNRIADIVGTDDIRLRFIAANEVLDINRREAVIGIRNRRPDGQGLAGRKIGRIRFAVYAVAPDITTWALVIGATPSAKWVVSQANAARAVEVNGPRNALDLALSGYARVVLPTLIGDPISTLRRLSPPIKELDHDQWLVTHNEDRFLPEVRSVIDRIYTTLKSLSRAQSDGPMETFTTQSGLVISGR